MTLMQSEGLIEVQDQQEMLAILGRNDELLRVIQECYDAKIVARGNVISFSGSEEEVKQLENLFKELLFLERQGAAITTHDVRYSIRMIAEAQLDALHRMYADTIIVTRRGRQVKAKTLGQWNYIDAIRRNAITIGIGPAGTGKTYLAVALAVKALKNKEVERIILTRPAVEAGEKIRFFCPATCRIKLTLTCALCMMRCMICLAMKPFRNILPAARLRLRRWRICAGAR